MPRKPSFKKSRKESPKGTSSTGLLKAYEQARAFRKKASALEDIARAKITAAGYEIDGEYGCSVPGKPAKMKLKPLAGLKKGK